MTTYGHRIFEFFKTARANLGGKMTEEQWIRTANAFHEIEHQAKKKKPKGAARERNPLFDALALATGQRNLAEIGRVAGKAIGVALADILQSSPDLTSDEVYRRAKAYRTRHPTWTLSVPALAKHWAEFSLKSDEEKTRAARDDVYQQPAEWDVTAQVLYGTDVAKKMKEKGWDNLGTDYRRAILARINAA